MLPYNYLGDGVESSWMSPLEPFSNYSKQNDAEMVNSRGPEGYITQLLFTVAVVNFLSRSFPTRFQYRLLPLC